MKNQIILHADNVELRDNELREWFEIMQRRIDVFNARTKSHTLDIKRLEKKIKALELAAELNTPSGKPSKLTD